MSKNIVIKASSKSDFEEISSAYDKFCQAYSIKGKNLGRLEIEKFYGIEGMVKICPEGKLLKSTPKFLLMELEVFNLV